MNERRAGVDEDQTWGDTLPHEDPTGTLMWLICFEEKR